MNKRYQTAYEDVKARLERLFQQAGYEDEELLRSLEELKLHAEQMRRELVRLQGLRASNAAERMSSKLKDALRE